MADGHACQRFDAVSIDQQHRRKLMGLRPLDKTLKPAETLTFSALIEQAKLPARIVASGSARYAIASGGEVAMSVQTGNRRGPHPKGAALPPRLERRGLRAEENG